MLRKTHRFYLFLLVLCTAGYVYLFLALSPTTDSKIQTGFCPIHHVTHIPCPSCGSTRSVLAITRGEFKRAFVLNPLGYIVAAFMVFLPVWIVFDMIWRKKTLLDFYQKTEHVLRKPTLFIPLLLLLVINWIWNIAKAL